MIVIRCRKCKEIILTADSNGKVLRVGGVIDYDVDMTDIHHPGITVKGIYCRCGHYVPAEKLSKLDVNVDYLKKYFKDIAAKKAKSRGGV